MTRGTLFPLANVKTFSSLLAMPSGLTCREVSTETAINKKTKKVQMDIHILKKSPQGSFLFLRYRVSLL